MTTSAPLLVAVIMDSRMYDTSVSTYIIHDEFTNYIIVDFANNTASTVGYIANFIRSEQTTANLDYVPI